MATNAKNVILKAKLENEIVELLVKTGAGNVYFEDGQTLATKMSAVLADLAIKPTNDEMNTAISNAIDDLIDGAPDTYDTLKEIATYISEHAEVVTALNQAIGGKVDKVDGMGLSHNDLTDALLEKLNGIAEGAEVNQNAYSAIKVGGKTFSAESKTSTFEFKAGQNVTLTPDADGNAFTISAHDTTYEEATQSAAGLMSADDKKKLDGVEDGANKTIVDSAMSDSSENPVQNKIVKGYIDALPFVHVGASQPANLKAGDIWISIVE